jgi:hypothetical protein
MQSCTGDEGIIGGVRKDGGFGAAGAVGMSL